MYYVQAYAYLGEKNTCMKLLYGLADYCLYQTQFCKYSNYVYRSSFTFITVWFILEPVLQVMYIHSLALRVKPSQGHMY